MLLDYGSSWLREYRREAATSPGSGGAATLPEFFYFALLIACFIKSRAKPDLLAARCNRSNSSGS